MNNAFLEKIKNEEELLKRKITKTTDELKFIDEFLTKNRFNNISGLLEINLCELMISYICSNSNVFTFDEAKEIVYSNRNLIDTVNFEEFQTTIASILRALEEEKNGKNNRNKILEKKLVDSGIEEYIQENNIENIKILVEKDRDVALNILALIQGLKGMIEEQELVKGKVEEFTQEIGFKLSQKKQNRIYRSELKDAFNIEHIKSLIKTIQDYYLKETKKIKTENRKIQKSLKKYQEFKDIFKSENEKEEITRIDDLVSNISNENLRKELLVEIYNHNLPVQEKIEKEYKLLSKDHKNQIKVLLKKYNIDYHDIHINYKDIELVDLEYELQILQRYGINDSKVIINIINNTTKEIIETIDSLVKNSIITKDFVIKNIDILNKNFTNSLYPILLKNLKSLKDNNVNAKLLSKDPNALLTNIETFNVNLAILEEYNLKELLKNASSYKFLSNEKLNQKIDKILELGYEGILQNNLDLLNYDEESWKKVVLYKSVGEEITELDQLITVLESDNINNIDDYIINYVSYIDSDLVSQQIDIELFEKYSTLDRTYNFDGVLISKNKVKRNIETNTITLEKILENSILTEDECSKIIKCIKPNQK